MGGLDLVGVDHQHRLGVDLRIGRQQQVLVRQGRVGAVGAGPDVDPAMEHHLAAAVGDAAPGQFAGGIAGDVLDTQAGIEMAAAVAQQHAVGKQPGAVAFQAHIELVARQRRAQFQVEALVGRLACQHRVGAGQAGGAGGVVLDPRVAHLHALAGVQLQHLGGQVGVVAGCQPVFDDVQGRVVAQLDQVAQVPGAFAVLRHRHRDQMQRQWRPHAFSHPDHGAFLGQGRIDTGKGLVAARVMAQQEVGLPRLAAGQQPGQRLHVHARRQAGQVAGTIVVAAVDEHQARDRDVGQQGRVAGRRGRVGGREGTPFQRAQRGVLPGLLARPGQAVGEQGGQRLAASVAQLQGVRIEQRRVAVAERVQQRAHRALACGATRSLSQA